MFRLAVFRTRAFRRDGFRGRAFCPCVFCLRVFRPGLFRLRFHVRSRTSKDGAGLGPLLFGVVGEAKQLVEVVGLEEAPLLRVFQHSVGQELLKDLPVEKAKKKI